MTVTHESAPARLHQVWSTLAELSADLTLETLLERVVAAAATICGARTGVFDVVTDAVDPRLGRFAAVGVGSTESEASGRSVLVGVMARSAPVQRGIAFVGVPVQVDGAAFGNLYLLDKSDGELTAEDEAITGMFATAAGTVISAALARAAAEQDRRWLEATTDIAATLLGPVSYEAAWQLVVDRALAVSTASCAFLMLTRADGDLYVEAASGVPAGGVLGSRVPIEGTLVGSVAASGEVVVIPRTEVDRRYDPDLTRGWPVLTAVQVLPLRDAGAPGALVVGWQPGDPVSAADLDPELPQRFVEQAALVLEMAHVRDDQRRLAVLEDRARISRDIHDVVIQRLYAIGMGLDHAAHQGPDADTMAETLGSAVDGLDETIQDLRRTIFGLSTGDAAGPDVTSTIERLAADAADLLGFAPQVTIAGPVATQLSDEVRQNVVAVVGELLSNAVQHSGAQNVTIDLHVGADVILTIGDDGRGISLDARDQGGNGLRNIRRRAELLGGACDVRSAPGQGTTIVWTVPGGNPT